MSVFIFTRSSYSQCSRAWLNPGQHAPPRAGLGRPDARRDAAARAAAAAPPSTRRGQAGARARTRCSEWVWSTAMALCCWRLAAAGCQLLGSKTHKASCFPDSRCPAAHPLPQGSPHGVRSRQRLQRRCSDRSCQRSRGHLAFDKRGLQMAPTIKSTSRVHLENVSWIDKLVNLLKHYGRHWILCCSHC